MHVFTARLKNYEKNLFIMQENLFIFDKNHHIFYSIPKKYFLNNLNYVNQKTKNSFIFVI